MFRCETHFHKWGRMQGMEPNDSQMHFHFGSCICVGVVNVQSLGWKGKKTPNWTLMTHYKGFEVQMLKLPSHHSFIPDLHELWSKEGVGVKLRIWLLTINPLKVGSNGLWLGHVIHCWKDLFESYKILP